MRKLNFFMKYLLKLLKSPNFQILRKNFFLQHLSFYCNESIKLLFVLKLLWLYCNTNYCHVTLKSVKLV